MGGGWEKRPGARREAGGVSARTCRGLVLVRVAAGDADVCELPTMSFNDTPVLSVAFRAFWSPAFCLFLSFVINVASCFRVRCIFFVL